MHQLAKFQHIAAHCECTKTPDKCLLNLCWHSLTQKSHVLNESVTLLIEKICKINWHCLWSHFNKLSAVALTCAATQTDVCIDLLWSSVDESKVTISMMPTLYVFIHATLIYDFCLTCLEFFTLSQLHAIFQEVLQPFYGQLTSSRQEKVKMHKKGIKLRVERKICHSIDFHFGMHLGKEKNIRLYKLYNHYDLERNV